jgi:ABC-type molybdate transport system permease subunit
MFAGIRDETRTLALQIYVLNNQPGDDAEARMWRVAIAATVVAFLALAGSEFLDRRGRAHEHA